MIINIFDLYIGIHLRDLHGHKIFSIRSEK